MNHTSPVNLPSRKAIFRGIQLFIFFSILGIFLGFWWKQPESFYAIARQVRWKFFWLVLPLTALNYVLGGLRFRIFFNGKVLPLVSLWNCVRVDWANSFMGAITPFQTGGGPGQLYVLWRCGARISDGILVALVNFAATLIFFLIASMVAALFVPIELLGIQLQVIIRTALIFLALFLGVILFSLFLPGKGLVLVRRLLYLIPLKRQRFLNARNRLMALMAKGAANFQRAFQQIIRKQKKELLLTTLVTLVLYFSKYVIGYLIAVSLEGKIPFLPFMSLQIIQLVILYFTPTPGGSGLAELSSVWLIGYLLSANSIILFTVLWRFFTTILGAIIGGFVLLLDLRRLMEETASPLTAEQVDALEE